MAVWPVRPMYEELKRQRILVRYMVYPGWGDGLRITVGTDAEIETCLAAMRSLVQGPGEKSEYRNPRPASGFPDSN